MELFALFGMHFLYDFHWQGPFVSEYKSKMSFILAVHAFTYAFVLSVVMAFYGHFEWSWVAFLFFTHILIDGTKILYLAEKPRSVSNMKIALYLDQIAHVTAIILIWVSL